MSDTTPRHLLLNANFYLRRGRTRIGLASISTLHDVIEETADSPYQRIVCLRRAMTGDRTLYRWYREASRGKCPDQPVVVVQLDAPCGEPVNAWQLEEAVPVRWSGPCFDAHDAGLAMEELALRYASIRWLDPD